MILLKIIILHHDLSWHQWPRLTRIIESVRVNLFHKLFFDRENFALSMRSFYLKRPYFSIMESIVNNTRYSLWWKDFTSSFVLWGNSYQFSFKFFTIDEHFLIGSFFLISFTRKNENDEWQSFSEIVKSCRQNENIVRTYVVQ